MEMTEYGKHGKPRNRLSTLPTLFGNPCGITTFPQPRLLAYFKMQDQERPNPRPLEHKGLVMEVPGPKCNGCSGTLRSTVEHPFATIKYRIFGHPRLLLRGLSGAKAEIALATMAYNLKRITNVLGAAKVTRVLHQL
ncbi:transposase [Terracidiphilus sp.]|uniref:transposase n=1 Tax=Terracidiphilus sp. TaxID=1964191 RepID=UPI003C77F55F